MNEKPVVLFLCTHNAGRSLAARVLLDHYAQGRIRVESAGSEPGDELNPSVVAILAERGLDPSPGVPEASDRRNRSNGRCHRHHGLRRHLPRLPRKAVCRLGTPRPGRTADRKGPTNRRGD